MKVLVLSRYRTAHVTYEPGQILEISEQEAQRLLADSPGSFEVQVTPALPAEPHFEAPEAPPADKMIRGRRNPNP